MRWILIACCARLAFAQGTEPKAKAEDYEVHAAAGPVTLGAEYMVRSFGDGRQMFAIDGFLVVEAALYPPKGMPVRSVPGEFSLRVNGKRPVAATPAGMAAARQRREWSQRPRMEGGIGVGDVDIGLGRPVPRYPDGQPVPTRRPPRAPDDPPGGIEREPPVSMEELIVRTALPEGEFQGAVSGFLYFPFTGKAASVKTVELLFRGKSLKMK